MANFTTAGSDTFPAGMLRQVKTGLLGDMDSTTSNTSLPSSALSFSNAIISGSHVFVLVTGIWIQRASDGNIRLYFTGGGLGSTTSGYEIGDHHGYGNAIHCRMSFSSNTIDTSPGSTTPSYQVFVNINAGTYEIDPSAQNSNLTIMELLT